MSGATADSRLPIRTLFRPGGGCLSATYQRSLGETCGEAGLLLDEDVRVKAQATACGAKRKLGKRPHLETSAPLGRGLCRPKSQCCLTCARFRHDLGDATSRIGQVWSSKPTCPPRGLMVNSTQVGSRLRRGRLPRRAPTQYKTTLTATKLRKHSREAAHNDDLLKVHQHRNR